MMKKKRGNGEEAHMSAVAESGHYVVGQVSGSLFPNKSTSDACKSSSLSALFQRKSSAPSVLFVPVPPPIPKTEERSSLDKATKSVKIELKKKKDEKTKTAAEEKLKNMENALENADKEEEMKKSRKIKRKAVGGGEMSLEEGEEPRKKRVINKAEEQIKSRRTVFVGNLPTNCTKKMLKVLFREFGAIESIRFRSVTREDATMSHKVAAIQRKVHPKRQSINSYVVFKDQDSAVRALKRNGMEIAKDFHIRVDLASKANSHNHKQSVFVGNLPYEVNELTVRQHFEQCGGIEAIRLVRDRDSGMGKGFGYVLFENVDAVQLALKLNNSELQGRKIRVKRSVKNVEKASGVVKRNKKTATPPERRNTKGVGRPSHRPKNKSSTPASQKQGKVQGGSSFRGEIAKPGNSRSKKNKGLKKKFRSKK